MDWIKCNKIRMVKEAKTDMHKIISIMEIAEKKIDSSNILPDAHYYSKITLLYDALREFLECIALSKGYKIYNHECYTAFLKEILNESSLGDKFDKFRILRNGMNYYGKKITQEEGTEVIKQMNEFIRTAKSLLTKLKNDINNKT
ncbi:TPA: hypothetical protein HA246_00665 [Candidatus Woesearchaeota archaeon]|nr:hypothetical protein [Candidatus Woesearchaeota archaeon]